MGLKRMIPARQPTGVASGDNLIDEDRVAMIILLLILQNLAPTTSQGPRVLKGKPRTVHKRRQVVMQPQIAILQ